MHTVFALLCFFVDFPISIRLTSLALWQSNDCPSASKATLMNMDKYFMWIHYERLHNHNKAKHNKTVCIFLGIYCSLVSSKWLNLQVWGFREGGVDILKYPRFVIVLFLLKSSCPSSRFTLFCTATWLFLPWIGSPWEWSLYSSSQSILIITVCLRTLLPIQHIHCFFQELNTKPHDLDRSRSYNSSWFRGHF